MKRILTFLAVALAMVGCKKYELNNDFTVPDQLVSPSEEIMLDVTSGQTVTLSWKGGGAADGGIVLYNVIFDKEGGDFSDPVDNLPSDLGAGTELTLSHSQLNILARKAGIKAGNKGSLIWTVTASRGGVVKKVDKSATIKLQRGEGIDNIPQQLYVFGSAAKEAGQQFRRVEDGLFVIYTKISAGKIVMNSTADNTGFVYSADENGKLVEGGDGYEVPSVPESGIARITVNFNTLGVKIEEISAQIEAVLEIEQHDGGNMAVLDYAGNGVWSGEGDVVLSQQSWGPEERYCFRVYVDGQIMRWGSNNGGFLPDGTKEYWYVYEAPWEWWNNVWKLNHDFDGQTVVFTVNTNDDGVWNHSTELSSAEPVAPETTPSALYLTGDAGETDNMEFRKEGDKFVLYTELTAGTIKLIDADGGKYYIDASNNLYIGGKAYKVEEASDAVIRITVDFAGKKVKFEKIGPEVYVENAWDHIVMATLTYQGLGKWAGEGQIKFAANGDERYSLRTTVDDNNVRWGSNKGNDGTAPDGTEEFWYIYEQVWDDWNNLYKFFKEDQDKEATFGVDANNLVHMRHSVTVKSSEPVPPTVAPADLALYGTGAETEGQAFRKVSNGLFVIYSRLKEGTLCFKSGKKNYFLDAEKGLLEGEGEGASKVYDDGSIARITVDYTTCTVKFEAIGEYAHLKFAADYRDLAHLQYKGNGVWKAENFKVDFIDPNKPETNPPDWLGWVEERYYFIISVDGEEKCWGSIKEYVENPNNDLKPNGNEHFYDINEFSWSQWDNLWKFDGAINGANIDVEINTNDNGVWRHTVTKK